MQVSKGCLMLWNTVSLLDPFVSYVEMVTATLWLLPAVKFQDQTAE